ncbi:hypothetical protein HSRCO_0819 [Halanaeroarchaeum sp. HSR-CO]|uniref:hypothetical protein n=1 Tax=Halanaeroarchaeum sp. HSR-CO TaxID=2866382 RepID=UPI00217E9F95|nr:hypothetical protein [Halanaeroarchaeum sp. HSR-CO]UWG47109.1 hypothetical protein HSRCO_0819 [Halanaeroarchaeum sp. HSR-CO]
MTRRATRRQLSARVDDLERRLGMGDTETNRPTEDRVDTDGLDHVGALSAMSKKDEEETPDDDPDGLGRIGALSAMSTEEETPDEEDPDDGLHAVGALRAMSNEDE